MLHGRVNLNAETRSKAGASFSYQSYASTASNQVGVKMIGSTTSNDAQAGLS